MAKYIKSNTTYTLRKRSQGINGGSIYERNWTTLEGQKLRFGKGKTPIYNDGNFVFTTSSFKNPTMHSKAGEIVGTYQYDDVKDTEASIKQNDIDVIETNDIRSYAYYGSCVELVEKSITNIINNFPACLYSSAETLDCPNVDGEFQPMAINGSVLYVINNPFVIDLFSKDIKLDDTDNIYRFMCKSFNTYDVTVVLENNFVRTGNIIQYQIDCKFSKCLDDDQWFNYKNYHQNNDRLAPIQINIQYQPINSRPRILVIYGFRYNDDVIFLSPTSNFTIAPNTSVIEGYFNNLVGFEKQLLTRKTKPLYTNIFITPIDGNNGIEYVNRNYTWPRINEYCIDIQSPSYMSFVQSLMDMATIYDEFWTDNLYNRMTHEAIKNFDWSYSKDYENTKEQDNIEGGLQMRQILRLTGRIIDAKKQIIDNVKSKKKASYTPFNSIPSTALADTASLLGWDLINVSPKINGVDYTINEVTLTDEYLTDNKLKWFGSSTSNIINSSLYNDVFMRNLLMSAKHILSYKGTKESINMVMALFGLEPNTDYRLVDTFYKIKLHEPFQEGLPTETDKIGEVNFNRTDTMFEDNDPFQNLPLAEWDWYEYVDGKKLTQRFVIPYFDKNKDYGHELYYQSKGGWGGGLDDSDSKFYMETVSYLNVVTQVKDLFRVDNMTINHGDIYYVVDLSDYNEYYKQSKNVTHFFYYKPDAYTTIEPKSWKNISSSDTTNEYYQKAMYLNDIINTKFGNNPHTGFGFYDKGDNFMQYLTQPFKYYVDNGTFTEEETKEFEFEFEQTGNGKTLTEDEYPSKLRYVINPEVIIKKYGYYYYYNSKCFIIRFMHRNNNLFINFIKQNVIPYILQVIPSTTILLFHGL